MQRRLQLGHRHQQVHGAASAAIATIAIIIATTATIATIAAIAAALAALAALAANAANAASIAAASAALAALVAAVAAAAEQLRRYAQYVPLCLGVFSRWRLLYGNPENMGYSKGSTSCGLRLDCSSCHQCPVRRRGQLDAASCLWCGRARRSDVPGYLRHVWCLRARLRAAALRLTAAAAALAALGWATA